VIAAILSGRIVAAAVVLLFAFIASWSSLPARAGSSAATALVSALICAWCGEVPLPFSALATYWSYLGPKSAHSGWSTV